MVAVWILAGCIVVSIAFFLPGTSAELWPNVNAAGLALAAYVAALLGAFARKKDITRMRKNIVLVCGIVAFGTTWFAWRSWEDRSHWQADQLARIGTSIARGMYQTTVADSLLNVLEAYYAQPRSKERTIGDIYRNLYPPEVVGDSFSTHDRLRYSDEGAANPADIFLTALSDTHVVWVARHPWFKGMDPEFMNVGHRKGLVQVRGTLTKRGLNYVTEN